MTDAHHKSETVDALWLENRELTEEIREISMKLHDLSRRKSELEQQLRENREALKPHCQHDWEWISQHHGPSLYHCLKCGGWR